MAEGDSIARLAARLHARTAGTVVRRSDIRHPRFAGADLAGQGLLGCAPRGKHLLLRTDGGWTVHSHLRMSGRWTVLGPDRRLPRDVATDLRIALRFDDGRTLAGIALPVLDVLRTADEHRVVGHLGPDLLAGECGPRTAGRHGGARVARPDRARRSVSRSRTRSRRSRTAPRPRRTNGALARFHRTNGALVRRRHAITGPVPPGWCPR